MNRSLWRRFEARLSEWLASPVSLQVMVILVATAIVLTIQDYIGDRATYETWFPLQKGVEDRYWELKSFAWWSGFRIGGYLLTPVIVITLLPGQRIRDYHLSFDGFFKHLKIYAVLFALVMPAVFLASRTQAFRDTYPFYRMINRSWTDVLLYEAVYISQFFALEFFFRGFLLNGLRPALGANAIFVMIVPYCMIHFGKPMPETFGAIGAGLILGALAMRTRSIWGGVLIHMSVAITMDLLALQGCPPIGSGHYCGGV